MAERAMLDEAVQEAPDAWAQDAPKHDAQATAAASSASGAFGAGPVWPARWSRRRPPPATERLHVRSAGRKRNGAGCGRPHGFRSRPAESPTRFGIAGIF